MNFDSAQTRRTYSDRAVDDTWKTWCRDHLDPAGKDVVDLGCGGGIYSLGLADLGARSVIGIDQSAQYIDEARQAATHAPGVTFQIGKANATGLMNECADLVFERALIHHLSAAEKYDNAIEARRLLRAHRVLCVQDRTFEDVQANDPAFWIRATLFEAFPNLLAFEQSRRPSRSAYTDTLRQAGFSAITLLAYQEIRQRYVSFEQLCADILARKGKSILFELTDAELRTYCQCLDAKRAAHPLIEVDLWSIWLAQK